MRPRGLKPATTVAMAVVKGRKGCATLYADFFAGAADGGLAVRDELQPNRSQIPHLYDSEWGENNFDLRPNGFYHVFHCRIPAL